MGYLPDSETFHQTWTKLTKQNNEDCEMWLKALKKVSELTFYQTAKRTKQDVNILNLYFGLIIVVMVFKC